MTLFANGPARHGESAPRERATCLRPLDPVVQALPQLALSSLVLRVVRQVADCERILCQVVELRFRPGGGGQQLLRLVQCPGLRGSPHQEKRQSAQQDSHPAGATRAVPMEQTRVEESVRHRAPRLIFAELACAEEV